MPWAAAPSEARPAAARGRGVYSSLVHARWAKRWSAERRGRRGAGRCRRRSCEVGFEPTAGALIARASDQRHCLPAGLRRFESQSVSGPVLKSGAGPACRIETWPHVDTNPSSGSRSSRTRSATSSIPGSVQDAIYPIAVERAEGRYFWDYDGKRYLDFASQLVNVSIGYGHPKVVAAIKEQAEKLATIGPPMATESRSRLGKLLAEVTPGDSTIRSSRTAAPKRTRTRSSSRAGTPAATRSSPATAAITARRRLDHDDRRPAPLARRARHPRRRADVRSRTPTAARPATRSVPGLHRRARTSRRSSVRGRPHRRRRDPRDRHRHERDHRPARRLPASRSARSATGTGSC